MCAAAYPRALVFMRSFVTTDLHAHHRDEPHRLRRFAAVVRAWRLQRFTAALVFAAKKSEALGPAYERGFVFEERLWEDLSASGDS